MLPEYRDLVTELKRTDRHFLPLFDRHNEFDQRIKNHETHLEHRTHEEIETLRKEKLHLKDRLYAVLLGRNDHGFNARALGVA